MTAKNVDRSYLGLVLLANQAFSYSVVFSEPTMKTEFKLHHLHFEIVPMKIKQQY